MLRLFLCWCHPCIQCVFDRQLSFPKVQQECLQCSFPFCSPLCRQCISSLCMHRDTECLSWSVFNMKWICLLCNLFGPQFVNPAVCVPCGVSTLQCVYPAVFTLHHMLNLLALQCVCLQCFFPAVHLNRIVSPAVPPIKCVFPAEYLPCRSFVLQCVCPAVCLTQICLPCSV